MCAAMKSRLGWLAIAASLASGAAGQNQNPVTLKGTGYVNDGEVHILPVRGNVFMLVGAGANITLSVGSEGVLMVDSGSGAMSDKVLAAIAKITLDVDTKGLPNVNATPIKPVRVIIDTSDDPDHVGGTAAMAKAGKTFTGGNVVGDNPDKGSEAEVYAHENVLLRMSKTPPAGQPAIPYEMFPNDTYTVDAMYLSHFFNGEGVQIIPSGRGAHGWGHHGVVPGFRCPEHRRHFYHNRLSRDRSGARRPHSGSDRWIESYP